MNDIANLSDGRVEDLLVPRHELPPHARPDASVAPPKRPDIFATAKGWLIPRARKPFPVVHDLCDMSFAAVKDIKAANPHLKGFPPTEVVIKFYTQFGIEITDRSAVRADSAGSTSKRCSNASLSLIEAINLAAGHYVGSPTRPYKSTTGSNGDNGPAIRVFLCQFILRNRATFPQVRHLIKRVHREFNEISSPAYVREKTLTAALKKMEISFGTSFNRWRYIGEPRFDPYAASYKVPAGWSRSGLDSEPEKAQEAPPALAPVVPEPVPVPEVPALEPEPVPEPEPDTKPRAAVPDQADDLRSALKFVADNLPFLERIQEELEDVRKGAEIVSDAVRRIRAGT